MYRIIAMDWTRVKLPYSEGPSIRPPITVNRKENRVDSIVPNPTKERVFTKFSTSSFMGSWNIFL